MDEPALFIVLDTNVVLSHALWPRSGPVQECFEIARRPGVVLVYSDEMISELTEVLMRSKFDRYASAALRLNFLRAYVETGLRVVPSRTIWACRDPKDNHILEAAVAGGADAIVTGDDDLLIMDPFDTISILSPADFVMRFKASR